MASHRPRRPPRPLVALWSVTAAFVAPCLPAAAAPGDLDPNFGRSGVVRLGEFDKGLAVAVAPDGGVVVGGSSPAGVRLIRMDASGDLDPAFGEGGAQLLAPGSLSELGDLEVVSDGRIVIAGASGDHLAVMRLSATGVPDATFGVAGTVEDQGLGPANDVDVPVDGRLVVVARPLRSDSLTVLRLLSDGTRDGTFGQGGLTTISTTSASGDAAVDVGPDGSIAFGGYRIGRLTDSGDPDPGFAGGGTVAVFGTGADQTRTLAVGPQGDVYAGAGSCSSTESCRPLALRFSPTGAPAANRGDVEGALLELGADGMAYVGGNGSRGAYPPTMGVARLTPDLERAKPFGPAGAFSVAFDRYQPLDSEDLALSDAGAVLLGNRRDGDGAIVARFTLGSGEDDLDADGTADARDLCPLGAGTDSRGCNKAPRTIRLLKGGRASVRAVVNSSAGTCVSTSRVVLYRRDHGRDERVARKAARSYDETTVTFKRLMTGRYYARIKGGTSPLARCGPVRSQSVSVGTQGNADVTLTRCLPITRRHQDPTTARPLAQSRYREKANASCAPSA